MRAVCAWCGTTIEEGDPGDARVSHGICPRCAQQWFPGGKRYAIVPADRPFLFSEIVSAFQTVRGIEVILDRRRGDRRRKGEMVRDDRRRSSQDRRRQPCLIVGALPTVAGLRL
jgi:hypothetical protein